jgi:uncharacterized membrane protein
VRLRVIDEVCKLKIPTPLKIIAVIQLLLLFLSGLDVIGFGIPFARWFVGFIFLTFVPGYLFLTILKWRKLNTVVAILYSVGLSIAFLMFVGVLINQLFPLLGINNPISALPLLATLNVIISLLWVLSYKRTSNCLDMGTINIAGFFSLATLLLLSIPCLSVLGIILQVYYGTNAVMLFLDVLILFVVALAGVGKFIPAKLYPLVIFVIAIALLLQYPWMSNYLTGYDVNTEYYFSNLVLQHSHWDLTVAGNINGMASIVMISPIYSIALGLSNVFVYKTVYPLLFAIVPVCIFYAFRKIADDKVAFLSAFFFISFSTFFTEMTAVCRQQIAELFLVLLLLLVVEEEISPRIRTLFAYIFGVGIIISHYGLSYIFLTFYLVLAAVILLIFRGSTLSRTWQFLRVKAKRKVLPSDDSQARARILTGPFILFFVLFAVFWYTSVSSSHIMITIVQIGQNLWKGISTEFFNLTSRGSYVGLVFGGSTVTSSLLRQTNRILEYITQFFIVVGVSILVIERKKLRIKPEIFVWTIASVVLIGACIILPYFANSLNMTRIYQITLIFLSLWCILGGKAVIEKVMKTFHRSTKYASAILIGVLLVYFLFSTGFVYEVAGDVPTSASLGLHRLQQSSGQAAVWFSAFYIWPEEVASASWLSANKQSPNINGIPNVFADVSDRERVLLSYGMISLGDSVVLENTTEIPPFSYVYLSHLNVVYGLYTSSDMPTFNNTELSPMLTNCSIIYSNSGSEVLYSTS